MSTIILNVVMISLLLFVLGDGIYTYIKASGSIWQRFLAIGRNSATVLWARALVLLGGGLDYLGQAAEFVGAPSVSTALNQYLDAKTLGGIMIAVAFITEMSRRRTLRHCTDKNNQIVDNH